MNRTVKGDRQEFEAWVAEHDSWWADTVYPLNKNSSGEYLYRPVSDSWQGWKAALRSHGKVERCPYCDGTGDVHSLDGEWRGECSCGAAQFSRLREIAYRDEAKSVTVRADDLRSVLTAIIGEGD